MRTHIISCNQGYGRVLYETEQELAPLTFQRLAGARFPGVDIDIMWVTRAIYSFMASHMTLSYTRSCVQQIAGEETNGLELWRHVFFINKVGSEQVQLVNRVCFHDFPKCANVEHLHKYLGLWQQLRQEHARNLPDEHLKPMLLNVLPKEVQADVRRNCKATNGGPPCTDDILAYLRNEHHRFTDESVAASHRAKLFSTLPNANKIHSLVPDVHETSSGVDGHKLVHQLQEVVAAFNRAGAARGRDSSPGRGRASSPSRSNLDKPDAKWGGGCWHCGAKDHNRRKCPKFRGLCKEHNGLPKNYEGEYEKWAKANKRGVPKYVVNQLQTHVKEILAEEEETKPVSSAAPSGPSGASKPDVQDIDKLLNWALLSSDQKTYMYFYGLLYMCVVERKHLPCVYCWSIIPRRDQESIHGPHRA